MRLVQVIFHRVRTWLGVDAANATKEQIAFVRPYQAPMIAEALRRRGISCEVVDGHSHATWEPMSSVVVSKSDVPLAVEVVRQMRES